MKIKILLFGMLADAAGSASVEIEFENSEQTDTDKLKSKVKSINNSFRNSVFVIAVNRKIVSSNLMLNENDEIALLPPFAGG